VVIDTPRGSRNKLKYDEELDCFTLCRILPLGHVAANPAAFHHLDELGGARLEEIEHFFVAYNEAHGRTFEPTGRLGSDDAEECREAAIAEFCKRNGS
jgi:inorganic pyrophosphatase